jgi:hypothetical protein
MTTCRAIIGQALRALSALAVGDEATVDELSAGMDVLGEVMLELHDARGPLTDIDVTADYIAAEDQRVRIQAGATVSVTLPNAVPIYNLPDPYDYGFSADQSAPPVGSIGEADGVRFRQPRDGTRIEIVGTTQALYFYRADLNQWIDAVNLTLDGEAPLNARYASALAAVVAERLLEAWPDMAEPTPALARRIARGTSALMLQSGRARDPVQADYL